MPAIHLRPGKRSLYPDTSTLIYGFNGTLPDADEGDRAVLAALREVWSKANLCLGFPHIQELARGEERARGYGQILDGWEIVWLHQSQRVQRLELRNLLLSTATGLESFPAIPVGALVLVGL